MCIAVLIAAGDLPKPDIIVMADTGREATETWEYTEKHVKPLLATVGLEVEVAPHSLAKVDLYSGNGDLLMPAYTSTGKLSTFCSTEWKKRVVGRYLRSKGYGPQNPVTEWIGMSLDEVGRCKPSGVKWREYRWPLVLDTPKRRSECKRIVMEAGLPEPPKSSCWMCPYRRNSQWRHLRDNFPRDWRRAVELDTQIRERDEHHDVYVHDSGVPLGEANIDKPNRPELALFGEIEGCDSGYCMV